MVQRPVCPEVLLCRFSNFSDDHSINQWVAARAFGIMVLIYHELTDRIESRFCYLHQVLDPFQSQD